MLKELLLASILGALLGFGITGGIVALKHNKPPQVPNTQAITPLPSISNTVTTISDNLSNNPDGTNSHQITIESPENNSLVSNSKITIKGSTTPLSSLIVSTTSKSYFSSADNAGNFSIDIEIDSGANQIQIDSIDPQDNQATVQLIITYSTTKI